MVISGITRLSSRENGLSSVNTFAGRKSEMNRYFPVGFPSSFFGSARDAATNLGSGSVAGSSRPLATIAPHRSARPRSSSSSAGGRDVRLEVARGAAVEADGEGPRRPLDALEHRGERRRVVARAVDVEGLAGDRRDLVERRDLAERTRSTESEAATRVLREKARKLELHIARLRGEAKKATGEVQRCAQLKDRAERDARALRAEVEDARKRRGELQRPQRRRLWYFELAQKHSRVFKNGGVDVVRRELEVGARHDHNGIRLVLTADGHEGDARRRRFRGPHVVYDNAAVSQVV